MSGDELPVSGGCQCGAVRYAMHVEPQNAHICHCRMCRRATGGLFAALAGAPKDKLEWTKGKLKFFASSNLAERGFCADCGTPLTFGFHDPEARIYVTIGSLDDPERAPLTYQYGVEGKLSFVDICENLPKERTGETPEAAEFFKALKSNQYMD